MKQDSSLEITYSPKPRNEVFIDNEEAGIRQAQLLEPQPQEQRRPISRCKPCIRRTRTPYFTLIQCLLVIIFYTLGIKGIIGDKITQPFSANGPQSPKCAPDADKHCQYEYFKVASWWDDCADKRKQVYRLFSYQYAHAGLLHLGMNLVSLLGFGWTLEAMVGSLFTFFFYELSAVFGAMAWSWAYPYVGIVGMSCGIYGIIGGLVGFCIFKHDSMSHRAHVALAIAMTAQILGDTLIYIFYFNPGVAWLGHLGGFNTGLLLALSFGLASKDKQTWKLALGGLSLASFLLYITYLLYYTYSPRFPSTILRFNPTVIHSYSKGFCCYEVNQILNSTYSFNQAKQDYLCIQTIKEGQGIEYLQKITH